MQQAPMKWASDQLFEPTLEDLISCVEKEVNKRRFVYPNQVKAGKMKPERAEKEVFMMTRVLELLRRMR